MPPSGPEETMKLRSEQYKTILRLYRLPNVASDLYILKKYSYHLLQLLPASRHVIIVQNCQMSKQLKCYSHLSHHYTLLFCNCKNIQLFKIYLLIHVCFRNVLPMPTSEEPYSDYQQPTNYPVIDYTTNVLHVIQLSTDFPEDVNSTQNILKK